MKRISYIITAIAASVLFVSCNCDDVAWEVTETVPKLSGRVVTNGNKPVSGATIKAVVSGVSYSTVTDADGYYSFEVAEPGEGTATASFPTDPNIKEVSADITLKNNKMTVCNFLLVASSTEVRKEKEGKDDIYQIDLPDIVQEEKSQSQTVTFFINNGTIEEDQDLLLETWYSIEKNNSTKAGYEYLDEDVVIHVKSKTTNGTATAYKPFTIEIQDLIQPRLVLHNGKEVKATNDLENNKTYFETTEFGETFFYYPIMVKYTGRGSEEIKTEPNQIKGYARNPAAVVNQKYGTEFVFGNTFLDQYVTLLKNSAGMEIIPKEITFEGKVIPSGEIEILKAYQGYEEYDYMCSFAHVQIKEWGSTSWKWTDRQHTGGSN